MYKDLKPFSVTWKSKFWKNNLFTLFPCIVDEIIVRAESKLHRNPLISYESPVKPSEREMKKIKIKLCYIFGQCKGKKLARQLLLKGCTQPSSPYSSSLITSPFFRQVTNMAPKLIILSQSWFLLISLGSSKCQTA